MGAIQGPGSSQWSCCHEHGQCQGFVSRKFFEQAIDVLEAKTEEFIGEGEHRFKRLDIINHLRNAIHPSSVLNSSISHHPHQPTGYVADKLAEIFGSTKALNQVYSANGHHLFLLLKGILEREDVGPKSAKSSDEDANDAFDITNRTKTFYLQVHGKDLNGLLGGSSGPVALVSEVNYADLNGRPMDNAFWTQPYKKIVYGKGEILVSLVKLPGVGVHEISHMVTQQTAGTELNEDKHPTGLNYTEDAGGLNEANSDQASLAEDQRTNNQTDPKKANWEIGKGAFKGYPDLCLRNAADPGTADTPYGPDIQKGYANYEDWRNEANKVDPHQSSAVGLKWYHDAAIGIYKLNGKPTWETVEKIRMAALPWCPPDTTYPDYAGNTVQRVKALFSDDHEPVTDAVVKAWDGVGVQISV